VQTSASVDQQTKKGRIDRFFTYWRDRALFIEQLSLPERHHEANVLLLASLDSLAALWQRAFKPTERQSHARRFGQFLVECSLEQAANLGRVSIPYVRWRAAEQVPDFPSSVLQLLQGLRAPANPAAPYSMEARQLRLVANDPTPTELLDADLSSARGAMRGKSKQTIEDWILDSRFAEILYREYRCAWIHEGRGGVASHGFPLSDTEPTYLSNDYTTPPRIGFSVGYIVAVLRSAVDGFEALVRAGDVDPVPPPHMTPLAMPDL